MKTKISPSIYIFLIFAFAACSSQSPKTPSSATATGTTQATTVSPPPESAPVPLLYAVHPEVHDPHYLDQSQYAGIRRTLAPLPTPLSHEEFLDDGQIIAWQLHRTPAQCAAAESQVHISLQSMYGDLLSSAQINHLDAFFADIYNDSAFMISQVKKDFNRPRPFIGLPAAVPCIPREKSASYPSGHAGLSEVFAFVLSDFLPTKKAAFLKKADQVGRNRIIAGVHYPSDIESGQKLAKVLYQHFIKSSLYRADFQRLKKTLPR